MKKVLIITYYWPPGGGGGVQRWLKFVKYIREFGYEPVIYKPANPNYPALDPILEKDVEADLTILEKPIWEPFRIYRFLTGRKPDENIGAAFTSEKKERSIIDTISNFVRSNFFIPDARKFWIKPSVRFLSAYLSINNIELTITTGPPHSLHLIGLNLKRRLDVKWIADFRDPWTTIDYYDELLLTKMADRKHKKLEHEVLTSADMVLTVSDSIRKEFERKDAKNVVVITNGYDEADMITEAVELDLEFSLVHVGTLMKNRNPEEFWLSVAELISENSKMKDKLRIKLIGRVDYSVREVIKKYGLEESTTFIEYLPHDQAIIQQKMAQVLLLFVNKTGNSKGMMTGKIFEYLASGRPVLAIGPTDGDLAKILIDTNAGLISDFGDSKSLKENILKMFSLYEQKQLVFSGKNIDQYSRRALTKKLAAVLDNLSGR